MTEERAAMKKIILFAVVLTFVGCGKKHDHGEHETSAIAVELDNGKKWKADDPTTAGISALKTAVDRFTSGLKEAALDDYQRLHGELQPVVDGIFKSCTMTGEAHHQLHNYLGPVVKSLMILKGDDAKASADAVRTLERHLGDYSRYFE
jgi:hypothetical protein